MPIISPFSLRRSGFTKFLIGTLGDSLWATAGVQPLADFRFDNGSIVDVISGATPTFTRPTTDKTFIDGSGVLQTAEADTPTYAFDQTTGQRLGIRLNCIAATNLLVSSRDMSIGSGPWLSIVPATLNQSTLGGGGGYGRFTANGVSNSNIYQAFTCTPNTTYTFSFYRRLVTLSAGNHRIAVRDDTAGVFFIVDEAPVVTPIGSTGWGRVTRTFTTPAGCTLCRVYPHRFFSDGADGIIEFDYCQVEAGPVATPPIITTGTALTRSADLMVLDGAEFAKMGWTGGECVIYTDFQYAATNDTNQFLLSATSSDGAVGANSDEIRQFLGGSSLLTSATTINNTTIGTLFPPATTGAFNKSAWRLTPSGAKSINGGAVVTTTFATPDNIEKIDIGRRQGGSFPAADLILRRLIIFPASISDAQLQAMSTP
jgi:hypothetical protein